MRQQKLKPTARSQDAPGQKSPSLAPPNSDMVELDPIVDQWLQELVKIAVAIAAREHGEKGGARREEQANSQESDLEEEPDLPF